MTCNSSVVPRFADKSQGRAFGSALFSAREEKNPHHRLYPVSRPSISSNALSNIAQSRFFFENRLENTLSLRGLSTGQI
jgi:hypothetical protein